MSTVTGSIIQQVSKQVKKAVEPTSSARPLPCFEYMSATGCEPSHRHSLVVFHRHGEGMREAPHADRNGRSRGVNRDRSVGVEALYSRPPSHGRPTREAHTSFKRSEPARPEPRDKECSMEIVATIAGGYAEGITGPPGRPCRFSRLSKAAELQCPQWCSVGEKAHASPPDTMICW
ncbi:hypothetical protein Cgig2_001679 [Carnegiea gigantea]|uniref:Uncharacterized protein n=1 Tax=Carnegiea gigantea TaxID=171969 RepID=A0A9Q1JT73_9CARY|nr:hypothetical protein Cgig2_001679 [Carnegiea gigantea]